MPDVCIWQTITGTPVKPTGMASCWVWNNSICSWAAPAVSPALPANTPECYVYDGNTCTWKAPLLSPDRPANVPLCFVFERLSCKWLAPTLAPSKPSSLLNCYAYDVNNCSWGKPICSSFYTYTQWLTVNNQSQCACGQLIERCINYIVNLDPLTTESYPFLCNICAFGTKLSDDKMSCKIWNLMLISFYSSQFLTSTGTYNGDLVYRRNPFITSSTNCNDCGKFLLTSQLPFGSIDLISSKWTLIQYPDVQNGLYTISILAPVDNVSFNPTLYFQRKQEAYGFSLMIGCGFQREIGTNATPISAYLWSIDVSSTDFTSTYFIAVIRTQDNNQYFNSELSLVQASTSQYPCRISLTSL